MGVLVQIREVPEPVHRTLKARAALGEPLLTADVRLVRAAAAMAAAEVVVAED